MDSCNASSVKSRKLHELTNEEAQNFSPYIQTKDARDHQGSMHEENFFQDSRRNTQSYYQIKLQPSKQRNRSIGYQNCNNQIPSQCIEKYPLTNNVFKNEINQHFYQQSIIYKEDNQSPKKKFLNAGQSALKQWNLGELQNYVDGANQDRKKQLSDKLFDVIFQQNLEGKRTPQAFYNSSQQKIQDKEVPSTTIIKTESETNILKKPFYQSKESQYKLFKSKTNKLVEFPDISIQQNDLLTQNVDKTQLDDLGKLSLSVKWKAINNDQITQKDLQILDKPTTQLQDTAGQKNVIQEVCDTTFEVDEPIQNICYSHRSHGQRSTHLRQIVIPPRSDLDNFFTSFITPEIHLKSHIPSQIPTQIIHSYQNIFSVSPAKKINLKNSSADQTLYNFNKKVAIKSDIALVELIQASKKIVSRRYGSNHPMNQELKLIKNDQY